MEKPKNWRTGQTIFNFLEWLNKEKGIGLGMNRRMADPFLLSDELWEKYYQQFLQKYD